jgi:hypothetical protein
MRILQEYSSEDDNDPDINFGTSESMRSVSTAARSSYPKNHNNRNSLSIVFARRQLNQFYQNILGQIVADTVKMTGRYDCLVEKRMGRSTLTRGQSRKIADMYYPGEDISSKRKNFAISLKTAINALEYSNQPVFVQLGGAATYLSPAKNYHNRHLVAIGISTGSDELNSETGLLASKLISVASPNSNHSIPDSNPHITVARTETLSSALSLVEGLQNSEAVGMWVELNQLKPINKSR